MLSYLWWQSQVQMEEVVFMTVRNIQASLPPPRASSKAATAHCSIIVSFCHMMAKACAVKRDALVGTLPPHTGVSSRSDDTWLLEGNSSIVQRIVAKILKSPEKPMISRLLEILSLNSLLTIHPGILHCCFQRSTNLPIGEPLHCALCSPSNR